MSNTWAVQVLVTLEVGRTSSMFQAPTLTGLCSLAPVMSYTWKPPLGQTGPPAAPANSSSTSRNSRRPILTGSDWCQTLIAGSTKLETIDGRAGLVVLMITPCDSAAE